MTKRLLIALLSLGLTMHVSGCTSGGSSEDGDVAESNDDSFSQESDGDFADASGEPAAEGEAANADAGGEGSSDTVADNLDDLGGGSEAPAEGGSTDVAAADGAAPADAGGGDELVLDTAEPLPEDGAAVAGTDPAGAAPPADQGLPADALAAPPQDVAASEPAPAPTDETVFNAAPPPDAAPAPEPIAEAAPAPAPDAGSTEVASSEPKPAPVYAPLKKVREQAYAAKDGTNLNRVYIARPGDTMKTVSQKIYGKNRSKDLKAWNGKSSVKTGDKIYYASSHDPEDATMKTFYEDVGVQPSTYTSKDGDNIRQVSKQLLGSGQSWKEVWATNPSVESKGDIPAGLEIRYWPEGAEASAVAAAPKETVAPAPMPQEMAHNDLPPPPPPMDSAELPPPPTDMAMNDIPPPPSQSPAGVGTPDPMAAGQMGGAQNVPPPPPPPDIPPPPPPEPKPVAKKMQQMDKIDSEPEADQMMWLGAGGIMLMAAAVLYVVIKKNRAKRIDLSQTQV
jgi:hypothetical protein